MQITKLKVKTNFIRLHKDADNKTNTESIVYTDTLLGAMYPNRKFGIANFMYLFDITPDLIEGMSPKEVWKAMAIDEMAADINSHGVNYQFDFCSGSRKHGDCIYSDQNGAIWSQYFKDEYRAISHGSILVTSCFNGMYELNDTRIVVLDDEDPIFNQLGIGDCFGLIDIGLAQSLNGTDAQFQFRLGCTNQFVGKGTLLPCNLLHLGVDMIIPKSSFKGYMPEQRQILEYPQIFLGVHSIARPHAKAKAGYSILNWFTSQAAKDHVLALTEVALDKLVDAHNDIHKCLRLIKQDEEDLVEVEDELDDTDTYQYDYMDQILSAEYAGQVHYHPKVIEYANKRWAKKYRETALSGGIKGRYLFAAPMLQLPEGIVLTSSLPTGDYIILRYPIRGRVDIRQAQVINFTDISNYPDIYQAYSQWNDTLYHGGDYKGSFFISPSFFAELAGDFDGDAAVFLPAKDHQALYDEIPNWEIKLPPVKEKKPILGNRFEVALKSFNNLTGLVSWINQYRWTMDINNFGGVDLDIKLADELQKAVDSFKSDELVDTDFLDALLKYLSKKSMISWEPPLSKRYWLHQYKSDNLFLSEGIASDIVFSDKLTCQMFKLGGEKWNLPSWKPIDATHFGYLFNHITTPDVSEAADWYTNYSKLIVAIFSSQTYVSKDVQMAAYTDTMLQAKASLNHLNPDERLAWAASAWRVAHGDKQPVNNQRASLCWYCFADELFQALSELRLKKFMGFIPKAIADNGIQFDPTTLQPGTFRVDWAGSYLSLFQGDNYVMSVSTSKSNGKYQVPWVSQFNISTIVPCYSKDRSRIVSYEFQL